MILLIARSAVSELDREVQVVTPEHALARIAEDAPTAVVVRVEDDSKLLGEIAAKLPAETRLIAVGNLRTLVHDRTPVDAVVMGRPDAATLRSAVEAPPPLELRTMLDELLALSVLDDDVVAALQQLTVRVARAFDADNCLLLLSQEATCYTAKPVSDSVIADLAPLCETVCEMSTTVIAPTGRAYRAFAGVPLAQGNTPLALLLLCRTRPVPFARDAHKYLRDFAERVAIDLAWRLVNERLLMDRDKLHDLSRIDPVLGVPNRLALQEDLAQRAAESERAGEPFSVAVIDVDGLRLINERNGYPAGDAVLHHIAQTARAKTRPQDMVARYAGDSVAIALPGMAAEDAKTLLTDILSEIDATSVMHEDKPIHLTVSAGIAELRYDNETGESALARAMTARQSARLHGDVIAVADAALVADSPSQPDFAIGTTLGRVYQIRHELSRGAFGVVYRAEDLALGRQVALKLLRPDLARDAAFVEKFRAEAATLARIRNPNLVQVYAFGVDGPSFYFAMELVEGQRLDERIDSARRRRRHLALTEVTSVIDQVADALQSVHQAGVLHRDVKPENVLIDRIYRRYVLVDVGIAVRRGSEKNPAGTPGFTAPEVFGEIGESPATDVYSLGALAYLLLTLQAPFGAGGPVEILTEQMTQPPTPPTEVRRDLPPGVDKILLSALDPDPHKRPQSARALAKGLSEALSEPGRAKPRMTLEPQIGLRRTPIRNASLESAPILKPSTRGVLFRSAYEVLGTRRGNAWLADVSRDVPDLEMVVGPHGSPLSWHPTEVFVRVLDSLGEDDLDRRKIALELGHTAIDASFDQFYGANPSAVRPAQVLRLADMFWRCYHSWGAASVATRENDAEITISDGIASPFLCATTAGLFAGVTAHAGGRDVAVEHPRCSANKCVFRVSWRD